MGIILSRFRRKLTSLEELERIEEKIQDIEKYRLETEQRQKKIVGKLVIYSVGVYVIAAALFYFLFFPASLRDRLFYIIPLLVFPIIVVLTKKLISWYYVRRMVEQQDLLRRLRSDKRQLLEKVKEKETYKVARSILEKFAPDQLPNNNLGSMLATLPNLRPTPGKPVTKSPSTAVVPAFNHNVKPNGNELLPAGSELRLRSNVTPSHILRSVSPLQGLPPGIPRPRPILPKETGLLDRLMESLVGDGPSWRYALICSQCHGHNGMALQEEFPFLAYRCCYCSYFNPAKKQRPLSPRLLDKEELRADASSDSDIDSDPQTGENEETETENKDCPNESGVQLIPVEESEESEKKIPLEEAQLHEEHLLEKDELKIN